MTIVDKAQTLLSFALLVLSAYSFLPLTTHFCLLLFFTHPSDTSLILFLRLGLHGLMAVVSYAFLRTRVRVHEE